MWGICAGRIDDSLFESTKMTFGEHLDELRGAHESVLAFVDRIWHRAFPAGRRVGRRICADAAQGSARRIIIAALQRGNTGRSWSNDDWREHRCPPISTRRPR